MSKKQTISLMVPTSSFVVELENCDFPRINQCMPMVRYRLPEIIKKNLRGKNNRGYSKIHNWAKDVLDLPYYLHTQGPYASLYVALEKAGDAGILEFEGFKMSPEPLPITQDTGDIHIWIKVLLAHFLLYDKKQVANESVFLHAHKNHATYRDVLKVSIKHNYKNRYSEHPEFFIIDQATRLKKVNADELKLRSRNPKLHSIPYQLSQTVDEELIVYKQLKLSSLNPTDECWVLDPNKEYRAKIPYHKLQEQEKSKLGLLHKFQNAFLAYARKLGVSLCQKQIGMFRTNDQKKDRKPLPKQHINIDLIDGRINREIPIETILEKFEAESSKLPMPINWKYEEGNTDKKNPRLLLMDYKAQDFKSDGVYADRDDPYKIFKEHNLGFPTQGIFLSRDENGYIYGKDFTRNLEISLTQLFLKTLTSLSPEWMHQMPFSQEMEGIIFLEKKRLDGSWQEEFNWLYVQNGKVHTGSSVERFQLQQDFEPIMQELCGRTINELIERWSHYHQFNQEVKQNKNGIPIWNTGYWMISKNFMWEVGELSERFFYDMMLQELIELERNEIYPIREWLVKPDCDLAPEDIELANNYNRYIRTYVKEPLISFNELRKKYGKPSTEGYYPGLFQEVFSTKRVNDGVLSFFRDYTGKEIYTEKSTKIDSSLLLHKGTWYNPELTQYFVGSSGTYQGYEQEKGFPMRKIINLDGEFNSDLYFSLLNVDFIRKEAYTVLPYPFSLIKIWREMHK